MKKEGRRKLEIPTGAVYALLAAVSLICVTVLAVALAGEDEVEEEMVYPGEKMSHLLIEDVYFKNYESVTTSLLVTLYVTNDGTMDATNVIAHIWPVVEGSNIATDTEEIPLGDIKVNETKTGDVPVTLKAGTLHHVEILLFDSGKLVIKGRAVISTDGESGTQYRNEEVRGTTGDSDYDGMPDAWEEHYGLDPSDPADGSKDRDGDGFSNLDEYKLSRDPTRRPGEEEEEDNTMIPDILGGGEDGDSSAAALGAGLFLVLIVGIIVVLIAGAVISHRRREKGEEEFFRKAGDGPPGPRKPGFEMEVIEGHDDAESDLPRGRGIYE